MRGTCRRRVLQGGPASSISSALLRFFAMGQSLCLRSVQGQSVWGLIRMVSLGEGNE
ncbi:hypothetical protein D3C85_856970 [compost metagenome]